MKKLLKRKKVKEMFRPEVSISERNFNDCLLRAKLRVVPQFSRRKDPDWMINFSIGKQEKYIRGFSSANEILKARIKGV